MGPMMSKFLKSKLAGLVMVSAGIVCKGADILSIFLLGGSSSVLLLLRRRNCMLGAEFVVSITILSLTPKEFQICAKVNSGKLVK